MATLKFGARRAPGIAQVTGVLLLFHAAACSGSTATQLRFANLIPSVQLLGATPGLIQVNLDDAGGNIVTNATSPITVSVTGPGGFAVTQTHGATNGVAVFDLTAANFTTPGCYLISATNDVLVPAFQNVGVEEAMMPPQGTIFAGAWVLPSVTNGPQNLAGLEADCGRTVALHLRYYNWNDPGLVSTQAFLHTVNTDASLNRIPVMSWVPDIITNITSGADDAYITNVAEEVAAFQGPLMLRWFWEMNLTGQTGTSWEVFQFPTNGVKPTAEQVATAQTNFISAWQRIRRIFDAVGAFNVVWLWNPGGGNDSAPGQKAGGYTDGFYPGDNYVDWVGVDAYNRQDDAVLDAYTTDPAYNYAQLAAHFKPMLIGETGAYYTDEVHQVEFFDTASETLQVDLPRFLGMDYFDGTGADNWNFTTEGPTNGVTEYSNMVNTPYFGATYPHPLDFATYHSFNARVHIAPTASVAMRGSNFVINVSVGGMSPIAPTGTVDIYSDNVWLTNVVLSGGSGGYCQARAIVKPVNVGVRSFVAVYSGDANNAAGQSWPVLVTISPLAPVFQSITFNNGTVRLTWSATTNQSYQLQYATALAGDVWKNAGSAILATNATLTTTDTPGNDVQRFYRVQLTP